MKMKFFILAAIVLCSFVGRVPANVLDDLDAIFQCPTPGCAVPGVSPVCSDLPSIRYWPPYPVPPKCCSEDFTCGMFLLPGEVDVQHGLNNTSDFVVNTCECEFKVTECYLRSNEKAKRTDIEARKNEFCIKNLTQPEDTQPSYELSYLVYDHFERWRQADWEADYSLS